MQSYCIPCHIVPFSCTGLPCKLAQRFIIIRKRGGKYLGCVLVSSSLIVQTDKIDDVMAMFGIKENIPLNYDYDGPLLSIYNFIKRICNERQYEFSPGYVPP